MIIAWRILYITLLARQCPNLPCTIIFSQEEWHVIYMMTYKKKPPKQPLPLSNTIKMLAQFGGYLNRKQDIEPGPTMLWIGLQRVRDFMLAHQTFNFLTQKTYG